MSFWKGSSTVLSSTHLALNAKFCRYCRSVSSIFFPTLYIMTELSKVLRPKSSALSVSGDLESCHPCVSIRYTATSRSSLFLMTNGSDQIQMPAVTGSSLLLYLKGLFTGASIHRSLSPSPFSRYCRNMFNRNDFPSL